MLAPDAKNLYQYLIQLADPGKWPSISHITVENPLHSLSGQADPAPKNAKIGLSIPDDLIWFEGHFPGQPVLPGIVQVHWAHMMATFVFDATLEPHRLSRIKFKSPMLPNCNVDLHLKFNADKGLITFSFRAENTEHSSGNLAVLT